MPLLWPTTSPRTSDAWWTPPQDVTPAFDLLDQSEADAAQLGALLDQFD